MLKLLTPLLALALCACAGSNGGASLPDIITKADAEAALAIAQQSDDKLAAVCFQYWTLHADDPHTIPSPVGPLSAYAEARVLRRKVQAGIPEELQLACGPVIMDSRQNVIRLLARQLPIM